MLKKTKLMVLMALSVFLSCATGQVNLSNTEIDAKLMQLKPLPKIHYYWPPHSDLLEKRNSRKLYELARITHSLCVSGEWASEKQVDNCVYICAKLNKTNPNIKASLGVNFTPWTKKFGKDLPPTDRGPTYFAEFKWFEERSRLIKQWVSKSNRKYGSNIKITALTLDCERFVVKPNNKRWNEGIRQALDAIHIKTRSLFPNARIEWYDRGIDRVQRGTGWAKSSTWTGKEIQTSLSHSIYTVPEVEHMRELFRRTCKLADDMKISDVTPWVALASGYRRGLKKTRFDNDWDYDIIYSYLIGAELNVSWFGERPERFAPYNRTKIVIFYPPPFDKRTSQWAKHFIAYVRGATGVSMLKDLGYEEE